MYHHAPNSSLTCAMSMTLPKSLYQNHVSELMELHKRLQNIHVKFIPFSQVVSYSCLVQAFSFVQELSNIINCVL